MASGDRTLKLSLLADTKNLVDGLKQGEKQSETFGDKIESINKKVGLAFAAMGAAAGAMALKFTKDAIGAASDMEETISKIGVIFGDSAKEVQKFADTAATSIGQSSQQALDAAATFAIFGKSAGLSGQALVDFSTDFVTLASDLASFNNTTPEDAIMAIGAALRGEAEPLRRYGVLLDDATLKAAAMELGIYSGSGALTAQQKVLAAQKVIMEQTSLAQGDFARTSDGLANSQRSIEAAVKDAQVQLGNALLPVIQQLATYVKDTVVPNLSAFIGGLTGKGSLTEGFNASQMAAVEWGKKARMVFDALVSLKEVALVVAATLAGIWVVSKIQAAVVATIGFINLLIKAYNALKASAIVAAVASRLALNPLAGAAASAAIFAVVGAAAKLAEGFDTDAAKSSMSYNEQREAQIAAAASGNASSSGLPSITSGNVTFPAITPPKIVSGSGSATTVAKSPQIVDINAEIDAEIRRQDEIKQAMEQQNARLVEVMAQRAASGQISAAPISIYVQAPSVIDQEGFSRAVVDALNTSQNRGTTGAGNLRTNAQIL